MTRVVNLRKEPYDVYIGRAGHGKSGYFGNPWTVKDEGAKALVLYRDYFNRGIKTDPEFKAAIEGLRGKTLGCFCKPAPCHGDVIVEYLEGKPQ